MKGEKKGEAKNKINNRLMYTLISLILMILIAGSILGIDYSKAYHGFNEIFYGGTTCNNTLVLFQDNGIKCLNNKTLLSEFKQGLPTSVQGTGNCGFILTNSKTGAAACTANSDKKNCYYMMVSSSSPNSQPSSSGLSSSSYEFRGCGYTASSNSDTYSYCCEVPAQSTSIEYTGVCGDGVVDKPNENNVHEECDGESGLPSCSDCGSYSCSNCQLVNGCFTCPNPDNLIAG